jgi:hypothetical protein
MLIAWNWALCILTSVALLTTFVKCRAVFLKPSAAFLVFFHIRVQWAGTMLAGTTEMYLPEPIYFIALLHGVPLAALAVTCTAGRRTLWRVWMKVVRSEIQVERRSLVVLLALAGAVTLYYLANVPFGETGLYTIFADPLRSSQARAESLKLLDNPWLQYAFTFLRNSLGPFIAVIATELLISGLHERRLLHSATAAAMLGFIFVAVSLPGERAPAAYLLLAIILSRFLMRGLRGSILGLAGGALAVLSIPALLTISREDLAISLDVYGQYLLVMANRAFVEPAETAMWYVHYAQTTGLFGLGAIPKLAWFFDLGPVDAANIIGLQYALNPLESVSEGTSFIFSYFSYFGAVSMLISLVCLLLLDTVVVVYDGLSERMLVPLVTSLILTSSTLVEADYTTVLLSNGFVVSIVLALILDRLPRVVFAPGTPLSVGGSRAG